MKQKLQATTNNYTKLQQLQSNYNVVDKRTSYNAQY